MTAIKIEMLFESNMNIEFINRIKRQMLSRWNVYSLKLIGTPILTN